jgi:hypothetical protein
MGGGGGEQTTTRFARRTFVSNPCKLKDLAGVSRNRIENKRSKKGVGVGEQTLKLYWSAADQIHVTVITDL